MSKRAFGSAFASSAPGALLVNVRSGLDAPQHQMQLSSPSAHAPSPVSSLRIPGQWPLPEHARDLAMEHYDDNGPTTRASSFITTVGRWATTFASRFLLYVPARLTHQFFRRQHIIVEPIVREDGAHKKRIIDAGNGPVDDEPTDASPNSRTRTTLARRLQRPYTPKRSPANRQWLPTASYLSPPPDAEPLTHYNDFDDASFQEDVRIAAAAQPKMAWEDPIMSYDEDAFIRHTKPSPASYMPDAEPLSHYNDFDDASFQEDVRIAAAAQPKMAWEDPTMSYDEDAFIHHSKPSPAKRQRLPTASYLSPPPDAEPLSYYNDFDDVSLEEDVRNVVIAGPEITWENPTISYDEDAFMHEDPMAADSQVDEDASMDDSLDFSFSDVLTGTPPLNRITGSPMPMNWRNNPVSETVDNSPPPSFFSRHLSSIQASVDKFSKFSPRTNKRLIEKAPVTPIRKMLLAHQVKNNRGLTSPSTPHADHTKPQQVLRIRQQSLLKQKAIQASVLKINAPNIAHDALEANLAYAKAREQRASEARAAELARYNQQFNFRETFDEDLSFLSDAPDVTPKASEELSFLSDAPDANVDVTPKAIQRGNKSVTWAEHAGTKAFFIDSRVSEMHDSILEAITFSPVRRPEVEESEDDSSDVDGPDMSTLSDSTDDVSSVAEAKPSVPSVGFTGVPPETWEDSDDSLNNSLDNSLDESQISIELLDDLQKKLDLLPPTTPTPPPPAVKPLVTPITAQEREKIDAAAKKSENGKLGSVDVAGGKISARDFSTLLPGQFSGDPRAWLNDNIINEYLGILVAHQKRAAGFESKRGGPAPPCHAFSSFWYTTVCTKVANVSRWAARFGLAHKQYLDGELILYPICDRSHWRLLAVKPRERTIEYLDSLGGEGDTYVAKLKAYLAQELQEHYVEDEWVVLDAQRSSRQINGSDCGVFTLLNALALLRGEEPGKVVACDGMQDARDRIAVTLMTGAPTTELD